MIQLDEYQPIKLVTYAGSQEFSEVKTIEGKVIGISHDGDQTLRKPNILFACSAAAWPEVEPYIGILDYVRKEKLQPTLNQSEYLDINNHLLKSVQQAQIQVIPVTRYGHVFEGTIEDFDEDAICMQIREHAVIVYRDGIYEFAIEELHQGVVTYFDENRGFGFIKSFEHESIYVHITNILDRNINELQRNQKVTFDLNHTTKGEGLSAINVELVES
jgi:cold shock CspA family protein